MRVHRITVENLSSLYGVHSIDLEKELFDAPIYLIVGPTGAGKSTLLDAVSLALFGETPRLANRRRRDGDDDDARHIMSRGTGECRAVVEFSRQAAECTESRSRYRATWYCHRAKKRADGAFQSPRRSLERYEPVAQMWTLLVDDARHKLIDPVFKGVLDGLEVRDFQRSMLLAQGEFTALLRASPEEKAGILERLTCTARFAEIGQRCSRRRQAAQQRLDVLDAKLRGIGPLPADGRILVETERNTQVAALRETRAALSIWTAHHLWQRDTARFCAAQAEAESLASAAQTAHDAAATKLARLAEDRRIRPAYDALETLQAQRAQRDSLIRDGKRLSDAIAGEEAAQTAAALDVAAAEVAHADAVSAHTSIQPALMQARTLALDAEHAAKALMEARLRVRPLRQSSGALQDVLDRANAEHRAAQAAYDQATRSLGELPGAARLAVEISGLLVEGKQLGAMRDALTNYQRRQAQAATRLDEATAQLRTAEQGLAEHSVTEEAAVARMRAASEALGEADGSTLSQLTRDVAACAARVTHARAWRGLTRQRAPLGNELGSAARQEQALATQRAATCGHIETLKSDVEGSQSLVEGLRATVEIISRRRHLDDTQACPLCGSEDHPSLLDPGLLETDRRTQELYDTARTSLEGLRTRLGAMRVTEQALTVEHAKETQRAHELARRVADLDAQIGAAAAALGGARVSVEREIAAHDEAELAAAVLTRALNAVDAAETAVAETVQAQTTAAAHVRYCLANSARAEELSQAAESGQHSAEQALVSALSGLGERLIALQVIDGSAEDTSVNAPPGYDGIVVALRQAGHRISAYQTALRAQARFETDCADTRTTRASAEARHEENQRQLQTLEAEVDRLNESATITRSRANHALDGEAPETVSARFDERLEKAAVVVAGHRRALQTLAETLANRVGQLAVVRQQSDSFDELLRDAQQTLDAELDRLDIASETALLDRVLSLMERQALTTMEQTLTNTLRRAAERTAWAQATLDRHQTQRPPELAADTTAADTEAMLHQTSLEHERVSKLVGALEEKLRQDAEKRVLHDETIEAQRAAVEDNALWQRLHRLIGAREGKAFQQFAQVLNLQELVDHANTHLKSLAPRYTLVSARDRDGFARLDFAVRDRHHAGRYRPITTLSGGETFLVSLSLALGLADMRTSGMRIETLLLDEGFGSLDPRSLDVAVESLEQVQATQQIQIGIISHVEALRDRIAAQVVVEPLGNGRSTIRAAPMG
ncbi:MAG: exonuclease SbcC [Myxococcota bacterium]|jgi:exonuclease SbcC